MKIVKYDNFIWNKKILPIIISNKKLQKKRIKKKYQVFFQIRMNSFLCIMNWGKSQYANICYPLMIKYVYGHTNKTKHSFSSSFNYIVILYHYVILFQENRYFLPIFCYNESNDTFPSFNFRNYFVYTFCEVKFLTFMIKFQFPLHFLPIMA